MDNLVRLKNRYYILRHGKSEANETGIILSNPDEGTTACGLTEEGKEQVRKSVQEARKKELLDSSTIIYSSDFVRCRETAEIVQNILGCDTAHYTVALRERFFGTWEVSGSLEHGKKHIRAIIRRFGIMIVKIPSIR